VSNHASCVYLRRLVELFPRGTLWRQGGECRRHTKNLRHASQGGISFPVGGSHLFRFDMQRERFPLRTVARAKLVSGAGFQNNGQQSLDVLLRCGRAASRVGLALSARARSLKHGDDNRPRPTYGRRNLVDDGKPSSFPPLPHHKLKGPLVSLVASPASVVLLNSAIG
jgi:hypothetical protein